MYNLHLNSDHFYKCCKPQHVWQARQSIVAGIYICGDDHTGSVGPTEVNQTMKENQYNSILKTCGKKMQ